MEDLTETPEPPSKTRRKQAMDALQDIGAELVELNDQQLAGIDLPENLRDAVTAARKMGKNEARRRQLQYIGKLMRYIDPAPIRAKLDGWLSVSAEHTARLHHIERWRERLLSDPAALTEFVTVHPAADTRQLRLLIRNTEQERTHGKPPRSFRALFQFIRELMEQPQRGDDSTA